MGLANRVTRLEQQPQGERPRPVFVLTEEEADEFIESVRSGELPLPAAAGTDCGYDMDFSQLRDDQVDAIAEIMEVIHGKK